ncbi:hypothetical protein [Aestuariivirga sp.]|uniref:hypothetical protein n=1 Tax=Aestuariivirga sp. TaxID=2650926 RepID=UPI003593DB2B
MKTYLLAALMTFALTGSALANQCPTLMQKIDAAMASTTVDEATKAKVMDLYNKGKTEHEAGDHAASERDLGEAMKLLGI